MNKKGEDADFNEDDISEYEDERLARRRNKKKNQKVVYKYMDDDYMIGSKKNLRACLHCKLVLNREKWNKVEYCPNCEQSGVEETTD